MIYLEIKQPSFEAISKRLAYYRTKTNGVPSVYVRDVEFLLDMLDWIIHRFPIPKKRRFKRERPSRAMAKR